MDEVYRTYRISIKLQDERWTARVTHVRGYRVPVTATASREEGQGTCAKRVHAAIDDYMRYLDAHGPVGRDRSYGSDLDA